MGSNLFAAQFLLMPSELILFYDTIDGRKEFLMRAGIPANKLWHEQR